MNKEFKLSILEMVILLIVKNNIYYGYDISQEVYKVLSINEGISFPTIKKLTNEKYLESYKKDEDNSEKKYYYLTDNGKIKLDTLLKKYLQHTQKLEYLLKGYEFND